MLHSDVIACIIVFIAFCIFLYLLEFLLLNIVCHPKEYLHQLTNYTNFELTTVMVSEARFGTTPRERHLGWNYYRTQEELLGSLEPLNDSIMICREESFCSE